jgi:UDP-2-acetamido-3-amino-2,3-dideoxy-glucuronate N-acetyltransferase
MPSENFSLNAYPTCKVSPAAKIDDNVRLGDNVQIWRNTHVRENVEVGDNTIIGSGVYIGPGVKIGKNCKIQNFAQIYEPAVIEDGVFIGPGVILTNDRNPRAVGLNSELKSSGDWHLVGTTVQMGASIGAGAICVSPITVGIWASVGAGSTVTKNVHNYSLVVGSPATRIGWVGRSGFRLVEVDSSFQCPVSQDVYKLTADEKLELLDEKDH